MTAKKDEKKKKAVGGVAPKAPKAGAMEEVVVDEAYLEAHPELKAEGVAVGDTIEVPAVPKKTSEKLDLDGEVSILKGEEYVRTYPEGSEEAVNEFMSKGNYVAVPASSVVKVQVSFKVTDAKTGVVSRTMIAFTEESHGESFKEDALVLRNAERGTAIAVLG